MIPALNVAVSALAIATASWLSRRFPQLAGFVVALPLATMLVLPLSRMQHGSAANTVALAQSIFVAVPVTLGFLLPFIFAERLGLVFWQAYALACVWLVVGFGLHRLAMRLVL